MLKIALTGGVGCGKSTVAKYFAKLGVPIIDADGIVHQLLAPNTSSYKKIVNHFGADFLTSKKNLNRNKLREIVFQNKKERIWLEKLLHPQVRTEMARQITTIKDAPYCIMIIPLLYETKFPPKFDKSLVIDCPKNIQIQRVKKRNKFTTKQIQAMLAAQMTREKRLKLADNIINNSGTIDQLKQEIKKLHRYYGDSSLRSE